MSSRSLTDLLAPLTPPPKVLSPAPASLWRRLLGHAWRWNPLLYHALKAAQVLGAELTAGQGKANLLPGQAPAEAWAELKSGYLERQRALLVDLLRRTMTEDPADAPSEEPTPWEQDPNPQLRDDHERWVTLLTWAWSEEDQDPFWALHAARDFGARILDGKDGHWRVEMGQAGYDAWDQIDRELLKPNREAIERLLRLAELGTEGPPDEAARVAARFDEQNRAKQQRLAL